MFDCFTTTSTHGSTRAAIVLIQTRWHEDDLAGRLLKELADGAEKWEVLSLPAVAENVSTAETLRRREDEEHSKIATNSVPVLTEPSIEPEEKTLRLSVSR